MTAADLFTLDADPPPAPKPARLTMAQSTLKLAEAASERHRLRPLSAEEKLAIAGAFSTRNPDVLLKSAPGRDKGDLCRAAWNGLQPNPHKVQIGVTLMLPRDAAALKKLGVWP